MTDQKQWAKSLLSISLLMILSWSLTGCSSDQNNRGPVIEGQITVDSNIDPSGDYSGIEILVSFPMAEGQQDTLYHAVTDSTGQYSGSAQIENRGLYPVIVSRNAQTLGLVNIVLAEGDTVTFNAQLPNINETGTIQSKENDVYEQFDRLQRNFNRVVNYVNVRGMSTDSVETEILKWSDLFWTLYQEHPDSHAGEQSAATSVSILEDWDNELMLARTDSILARYNRVPRGLRNQLTLYYAEKDSLESSVSFLNQLEEREQQNERKRTIQQERISLLYDSARTDRAEELLRDFRQTYTGNNMAMEWADRMNYDLTTLAAGKSFPDFLFEDTEDRELSKESLSGTPFMIEFTRLDAPLYQEQYDRAIAIHQIYRNFGLKIVTVPIGASDVVFDAFFEERARFWNFAKPGSFNPEELIERYNLDRLPTRFLVNDQGIIIQRYVGTEFDGIVQGLQKTITQQQTEL